MGKITQSWKSSPLNKKRKNVRAYHKQADCTCLSWSERVECQHSNFEQRIVSAYAHIHEGNEGGHLQTRIYKN